MKKFYDDNERSEYKVTGTAKYFEGEREDPFKHGLEEMDGGGMQHGSHPAKSQPKIMRFYR